MHQSLFTFIFTSITSPPGYPAHLNIREMPSISSYYKLTIYGSNLKCLPLLLQLPLVPRKLENRLISKANYSLIKLALSNFDFNQLTFTTALQETLIY